MSDTKRIDDQRDAPTEADAGTAPLASSEGASPSGSRDLRLREVIGRGGMGQVFRGEQVALGRSVAFKQLLNVDSKTQRERFVREAQITAQLDHPNIVPIHSLEVSTAGGVVGYAMKLVEGKTLRGLLNEAIAAIERGEPLTPENTRAALLDHFLKICDAVAFAHARGVLHRDLKPPNVMIGKFGEVYVMDWGVARAIGSVDERAEGATGDASRRAAELTRVGQVVGTAAYMSPEQAEARNTELDARSDQYALGLILFEIVSLQRPLGSGTDEEIFARAKGGKTVPLEHVSKRERIPAELRAVVEKATAFNPDDRYASVAALGDDVRRYLRGEAVEARPDSALESAVRWVGRHGRVMIAVLLGVVALSALAISWTSYRKAMSELEAKRHGEALTALYIDVAAQSRRIDAQFQLMEEALEGLRTAAEWALTGPAPPADVPALFFDTDFADPRRRPADFTDQSRYRWPVSMDSPVVAVAPGNDRQALTPKLRRLATLRDHMADMFIAAGGETPRTLSPEAKRRYLLERKSPIDYAYVLLPEGVHFMLPGMDSMPPGYDVRTSSFYTMSADKPGRRWGAPYVDSTTDEQGDDLVLPCTQALWSPKGEFIGVAGVEITVTKLVTSGLVLPGRTTVRASLVTGEGKKVIDSFDANKRFKTNGKDEGLKLADFDIPEVTSAVRGRAQGIREIVHAGKSLIVVFVRLDVLGWFYVVEIDSASLSSAAPR
ncbi:MAG: protein kinase [Labilithrix sp.]|nr:protein kinase [Labilithrix sp.]